MEIEDGISIGSRFYCCYRCRTVLAGHDDIVNKNFKEGGRRRAFLFSHVVNTVQGDTEDRIMITGKHMVADVTCEECGARLGWKYEKAYDERNKFKVGKTVLVKARIANCAADPIFY